MAVLGGGESSAAAGGSVAGGSKEAFDAEESPGCGRQLTHIGKATHLLRGKQILQFAYVFMRVWRGWGGKGVCVCMCVCVCVKAKNPPLPP